MATDWVCIVASFLGLFFHVVGEGVVRLLKNGRSSISDRENYIDFRMRLLGEPGNVNRYVLIPYFYSTKSTVK